MNDRNKELLFFLSDTKNDREKAENINSIRRLSDRCVCQLSHHSHEKRASYHQTGVHFYL